MYLPRTLILATMHKGVLILAAETYLINAVGGVCLRARNLRNQALHPPCRIQTFPREVLKSRPGVRFSPGRRRLQPQHVHPWIIIYFFILKRL